MLNFWCPFPLEVMGDAKMKVRRFECKWWRLKHERII
jgi:hypothetical protein